MDRIPDQIAVQLVEFAADSPFFKPFENLPESFAAAERERLRAAATEIIEDTVLPAYRELDRYFNKKYLPAARDSISTCLRRETASACRSCPTAMRGMNTWRVHLRRRA
jgi:uncharacterized protein (DUF885 family)